MHRLRRCFFVSIAAVHLAAAATAQTSPGEPPRVPDSPPAGPAPSGQPPTDAPARIEPGPADRPPPRSVPLLPNATSSPEQRIEDLERRLRQLEEKHSDEKHVDAHDIAPDAKAGDKGGVKGSSGVALAYGPDGVGVVSADGKFQFRLRPIVQADARFFLEEGTSTFLMRRVRPAMEGTAFEFFDWRLMPELAGTPNIQDAYVNIRLFKEIQLRGGKFKPPVGLERLMGDPDLPFLERGLPTNLVPDRDVGVQLHGDILGGTLVYAGGVFNGVGDGVNGDNDNSDKKDVVGRIMLRPFQPTFLEPLRKLGLGIAATRGTHVGALPPYRTPVGTTFFQYADGVNAGGTHRRLSPQASFYLGPFGIFGEYTRSTQIVVAPAISTRLNHEAWQVVASFFVTGEEAAATTVTPKRPLSPRTFGTGAVELVARYGELRVDDDAFRTRAADPTKSARKATDWGVGANWHMARNFKLMIDYEHTSFSGGSATGDRRTEILILTRLQAAY
ncbi:MAG TPA: porin [Polyangiaceae bacterium]|nr:porin [Polyangiaceae bacterium]